MSAQEILLRDYQAPAFLISTVHLFFDVQTDGVQVTSTLQIERQPHTPKTEPLVLDGVGLTLHSVALNEQPLSSPAYMVTSEHLTIPTTEDRFTLRIVTDLKPALNTRLEGLYQSLSGLCTQCEAQGFRHITYYLDRPDVLAKFTVRIEASQDRYPILLSNGNQIGQGILENERHWAMFEDPFPKPAYLFALVAGRFGHVADHYQTLSGRKVTLDIYVEPGKESRAHHALFALKKAMRWDEETYGLEYDLDRYVIVSVPDFNMGAMENKGLNVFNDKYILVSPESATDSDYEHVESVVGHEYFHNWTGNRVTLRDWFQLSLKEGLTVYREQQFAAAMGRAVTKRLEDVDLLRTRQFSEDAGPLAHPVRPERYEEINNFYTATIYEKGAEVIRMLSTIVGEEGFIDGVKHYLKTWDGHAATVENFIAAIGESNQKDLSRFITWYEQPGTPMVRIASSYDKDRQIYTLRLEQERPKGDPNKPLMIPVKVGLLNPQTGEWMLLDKRATKNPYRVLLLEEEAESFNFMHVETEPLPAILMDFSAPVHIEYPYTPQERMIMVEHVADPYLRWDSAQQLYTHNLKQLLRLKQQNKALLCDTALGTLIAQVATQKDIDQNLAAMLLQLPRMTQFLQGCKNIDPLEVEAAYTALEDTLAKAFEGPLATCYEHLSQPGRYAYSPESVSKRALKNACLGWLVKTQQMSHIQSAVQQYSKADNMTDAWAALASVVLRTNGPEAKQLLTLFQERWSSDALVMDKWLSLQASSWQANTLETVKQLSEGTVFNWKNPNKVYALIRTFVVGNPLRFHRKDGKGYQFLSHCLRKVDALNPQVASSLVEGFADWKRYAAPYSTLMKAEMDALLKTGTLSKNVQERLSKIARA